MLFETSNGFDRTLDHSPAYMAKQNHKDQKKGEEMRKIHSHPLLKQTPYQRLEQISNLSTEKIRHQMFLDQTRLKSCS